MDSPSQQMLVHSFGGVVCQSIVKDGKIESGTTPPAWISIVQPPSGCSFHPFVLLLLVGVAIFFVVVATHTQSQTFSSHPHNQEGEATQTRIATKEQHPKRTMFFGGGDPFDHFGQGGRPGRASRDVDTTGLYETLGVSKSRAAAAVATPNGSDGRTNKTRKETGAKQTALGLFTSRQGAFCAPKLNRLKDYPVGPFLLLLWMAVRGGPAYRWHRQEHEQIPTGNDHCISTTYSHLNCVILWFILFLSNTPFAPSLPPHVNLRIGVYISSCNALLSLLL